MHPGRKPWWQQATALVTVTTSGAIAGLTFVPGVAAAMTTPSSVPLHLLALDQAAHAADGTSVRAFGAGSAGSAGTEAGDGLTRSAIVNVAKYYLQLATTRTPAQMEALIWDNTSLNDADHGPSCAAFASLTLELAARATGRQSWVTGGSSYPWPVAGWADVRVNPNPASLAVTSIVQDATAHERWHPIAAGGYQPRPGDWAVFDGHVEVVTGYHAGTLDTIGADSLPGLTVNAHTFHSPLAGNGIQGFVDNGNLEPAGATTPAAAPATAPATATATATGPADPDPDPDPAHATSTKTTPAPATDPGTETTSSGAGGAEIPGVVAPAPAAPVTPVAPVTSAAPAAPAAPTARQDAARPAAKPATATEHYRKYTAPQPAPALGTQVQQDFISLIAPGAMAAQQRYGVPASVTIAQAIEESAWGVSTLAAADHNLFGIKGTGPAGSILLPTSEYLNGQWVTVNAPFRVYHNVAESIADHAELLATSGYYTRAMADRAIPDAFANDLTGVYATDPHYGANLIALMRLYNLYRFDTLPAGTPHSTAPPHAAAAPVATTSPAHAPQAQAPAAPAGTAGTAGDLPIPGLAAPTITPAAATITPAAATPGTATGRPPAAVPASGTVIPGALPQGSFGLTGVTSNAGTVTTPARPPVKGATTASFVRFKPELPTAVTTAFFASAKAPLLHAEQLYREVAGHAGIRWELLAACDWMQCKARPRYSPVHGEKIGSRNADGTAYRTKSQALAQTASDLVTLTAAVYRIDLTARGPLPVRSLADAFAAFRWGELLRRHHVSAMEFPYSVAGLTEQHTRMRWPDIDDQDAPDRPGARFREPFGAVPVVLSLGYPATVLSQRKRR